MKMAVRDGDTLSFGDRQFLLPDDAHAPRRLTTGKFKA